MKKSVNVSKVSIARQFEIKPEIKDDFVTAAKSTEISGREVGRRAALSALESVPPELLPSVNPNHQHDATKIIHKILDRVISMGENSGDRLRGLEAAEAVLRAAECSKAAKMSADLAKQDAVEAELNAKRVCIELERLESLCEPGFDAETMQAIRQLISAGNDPELPCANGEYKCLGGMSGPKFV
ncbi:hypothetical protein G6514_008196 [Epicoccum nigrum]|nr:hypothetical protein G6514_008196 [Epicoccum nigrum]